MLNPKIVKDGRGVYWLEWTPDPSAEGYAFRTPGGSSRTFDPTVAKTKLGVNLIEPVAASVSVLDVAARTPELATYPPTAPVDTQPRWLATGETNQRDPNSTDPANKYGFGWVHSIRPAPGKPADWQQYGFINIDDYKDEWVHVEYKRFLDPDPGRTTNFHLQGGDEVHNGVSPLSMDQHPGPVYDKRGPIPDGCLAIYCQAEGDGSNNVMHWLVRTKEELAQDRSRLWRFEWHVRFRRDRSGYVKLLSSAPGVQDKWTNAVDIRTIYENQKPGLFLKLGEYESEGYKRVTRIEQSLDQRGATLPQALADVPRVGAIDHSVTRGGTPNSSVVKVS